MEQMVIGAVIGRLVTSESRTDHFKIRSKAQTPRPRQLTESSNNLPGESDSGPGTEPTGEFNTSEEEGTSLYFNEIDSSGEMALILQAQPSKSRLKQFPLPLLMRRQG